ncbi:MAG: transporter substrate-binding domain-containing protein [Pseudomonadales bacterium]|nr:transporter substrate-binding domain-containing protein [Pseudomonadales bacterium]
MRLSLILIVSLLLIACNKGSPEAPPSQSPEAPIIEETTAVYQPYTLTGDIDKMNSHGELRLLAKEFDHLQHQGLDEQVFPMNIEQAEAFARSINLKPVWIYAASNEELINLLNQGKGDLIISNLTQLKSRKERIAFSHPIDIIDEVLIYKSDRKSPDLLNDKLLIAAKDHSAYAETAAKLQAENAQISIKIVSATLPNLDMLTGVENGDYDATIIDGDIAESLLNGWSTLKLGKVVAPNRKISWAVRKTNPELHRVLNQYLLSHSILSSRHKVDFRDFAEIKKQRKLRVITLNSPASYFMWRGEFKGFDYELMQAFAKKHNLRLQMIVRDSPEAMIASLKRGEGDVIAGSLTIEKNRAEAGLIFTDAYLEVYEQIIGQADEATFTSIEDLNGKLITVNPESSFYQTLLKIQSQGIEVKINPQKGYNSSLLQAAVDAEEYDYTMADSHLATIESHYLANTKVLLTLEDSSHLAWGLRKEQPALKKKLNAFIKRYYKSLNYNISFNKYFVKQKPMAQIKAGRIHAHGDLSPYDKLFKKYAEKYGYDWRIITSQSYQESKFNPKAKSYAGAIGLMQVMPRTGESMGYKNLYHAESNVAAAMKFTHWLNDRFPESLPIQEKIYFSLAAYNAGHGHVHDARSLARKMGKNPNLWFNNVEDAMLLLAKRQYYKDARYGYVRGTEPVKYVREISNRYLGYVKVRER